MYIFTLVNAFPGASDEQLSTLIDILGLKNGLPSGMKFFLAGAYAGGQTVVLYWKDTNFIFYDDWVTGKYLPACKEAGLPEPVNATFRPTYSFGTLPD